MSLDNHYFYNVIRKVIVQFSDIFNDIDIARYDVDGNITKFIKVPVKVSPKTKQWYWTELRDNKDRRDQIFPMMAVDLTNIEYDSTRQINKHIKVSSTDNGSTVDRYINPSPYDFLFTVQIASQYIADVTQILEQILPRFIPEGYIRITIPELNIIGPTQGNAQGTDILELRVIYDSTTQDSPIELDEAGYRIILWNIDFRVQGYLFSPVYKSGVVHKIVQSYYTTEQSWSNRNEDIETLPEELSDNVTVRGVTYAGEIPPPNEPIDDSYRKMIKYEHYPQMSNELMLYLEPPLNTVTSYPFTFEILTTAPNQGIWYTITEIDNEYILDGNDDFIIHEGQFVILDSESTELPTYPYVEPIILGDGYTNYLIRYLGVDMNGATTPVYSEVLYSPLLPDIV